MFVVGLLEASPVLPRWEDWPSNEAMLFSAQALQGAFAALMAPAARCPS